MTSNSRCCSKPMTRSAYSNFSGFITSMQRIQEGRREAHESYLFRTEKWIRSACLNVAGVVIHEAVLQAKMNGNASHCKNHRVKSVFSCDSKEKQKQQCWGPWKLPQKLHSVLLPVHPVLVNKKYEHLCFCSQFSVVEVKDVFCANTSLRVCS